VAEHEDLEDGPTEQRVEDEEGEEGEDQDLDQGEWRGITDPEQAETAIEGRSGTKPKKPPTGEELRAIKDATNLFRSSSFKLQVNSSDIV
jgi:U3 small nucleolar RNA-associated protein 22